VWETVDPDGRRVILGWAAWSHIVSEHDDLGLTPESILGIVEAPHERLSGRELGEE
jgi:hypothetical protein